MTSQRKPCSVEGCHRAMKTRGWCDTHYARWRAHGDVNTVTPRFGVRRPREITVVGEICLIPLSKGKTAIVDKCDYDLVKDRTWYCYHNSRAFYAKTEWATKSGERRKVSLHRLILCADEGVMVDHVNGDGLDCRRVNLRCATNQQNQANARLRVDNTSGFKGVGKCRRSGKWVARIRMRGQQTHLGMFETPEDAHRAYAEAARAVHGEFARLS